MDNTDLCSKSTTDPLTNVWQEVAFTELRETDIKRLQYLAILREWIRTLSILQSTSIINDNFLLTFLRGSKFYLKRTQKKIINYFDLQDSLPEIFNSQHHCDNTQLIEITQAG